MKRERYEFRRKGKGKVTTRHDRGRQRRCFHSTLGRRYKRRRKKTVEKKKRGGGGGPSGIARPKKKRRTALGNSALPLVQRERGRKTISRGGPTLRATGGGGKKKPKAYFP